MEGAEPAHEVGSDVASAQEEVADAIADRVLERLGEVSLSGGAPMLGLARGKDLHAGAAVARPPSEYQTAKMRERYLNAIKRAHDAAELDDEDRALYHVRRSLGCLTRLYHQRSPEVQSPEAQASIAAEFANLTSVNEAFDMKDV